MIPDRVWAIIDSCETQEQLDNCRFIAEAAKEPEDYKQVAAALSVKSEAIRRQRLRDTIRKPFDPLNP